MCFSRILMVSCGLLGPKFYLHCWDVQMLERSILQHDTADDQNPV